MLAEVTEAMPPPPLDLPQKGLKVVGVFTAGAKIFMEAHQIFTIEDMLLFLPGKSRYLINVYNGQQTFQTNKFGISVQKKVAAIIY